MLDRNIPEAPTDGRRPNFLLIMTDQQRADHLGAYGNGLLRTPHIDALADEGMAFDRFYVNSPVCMPNRAAIMTGRMPSAAGVRMNGVPLPLSTRSFVEALRESGYRTALIGKAHFQNMTEAEPAAMPGQRAIPRTRQGDFDLRDGPGYDNESPVSWRDPAFRVRLPYYGFDEALLCLEHGDRVGGSFARWLEETGVCGVSPEGSGEPGAGGASVVAPQARRSSLSAERYPTTFIADKTIQWLRAHAGRDDDRHEPFFVQCSFPDPHHPFTPPEPYWSAYSPNDVSLPHSFHGPPALAPPHKRAIHEELSMGLRKTAGSRVIAVDETEARQAIAFNYGSIAMIDDAVGRIISALRDLGLLENTVVIFMSDHGDFMGDHGLLFKGPLHYQSVIRMPFLWRDPAYRNHGRRCGALASAMDIAPTILDRAGVQFFNGMQGRSLMPLIGGKKDAAGSPCVLIEEESHRSVPGLPDPPRVRTLIADRWRLSVYQGADWGELYDLSEDPWEMHNLFGDGERTALRTELLWKLSREMIRLAPNLPLPMKMA
jgi:arylsulfatase A-like enzyme